MSSSLLLIHVNQSLSLGLSCLRFPSDTVLSTLIEKMKNIQLDTYLDKYVDYTSDRRRDRSKV